MPADSDAAENAPLVLVVDDFADGRALTVEILRLHGLRVAEAATGRVALEKTAELAPDAILMDLSLPEIDGWEVIRRLRADPLTCKAVILAYTAHAVPEMLARAKAAGCDAVLTKPCRPDDLVRALEDVLGRVVRSRPNREL